MEEGESWEMTRDDKRHYWVIGINGDVDVNSDEYDIEEVRGNIVLGLKNKFKYISVVNEYGENIYEKKGHRTETFDDMKWIEVLDADGELDIESTADIILEDFLTNHVIVAMLFEKDLYEELDEDKSWIDTILDDED